MRKTRTTVGVDKFPAGNILLLFILSLLSKTEYAYSLLLTETNCSPLTNTLNSRLFLDTAIESEWDELLPLGIFHGITTNPTLLERANHPCTVPHIQLLAQRALSHQNCQEFMCQAWGTTAEQLYSTGMKLSTIDGNRNNRIVIKVPVTKEGTKAASMLVKSGVRICLTACYSSHQALVATSVGAEYLAPYLGRMNDAGRDGMQEILTMQGITETCCSKYSNGNRTRIFVASIRDVESMVELASKGLDTFTFAPDIARALFMDPLTEKATEDFQLAATRGHGKNKV